MVPDSSFFDLALVQLNNGLQRASFNCSNDCHGQRFLIDAGTGLIERLGHKYALACGPGFVRIVEVAKVAVCVTLSAAGDPSGVLEISGIGLEGHHCVSVLVEEPGRRTYETLKHELTNKLDLPECTIPKFVLADGALLGVDMNGCTIAELFGLT